MKEKKILEALTDVDDNFIEEAEPEKKTKSKTTYIKWIAVAACIILAVGIGITINHISNIYDGGVISEEETTTALVTESNEEVFEEGNTEIVIEEATMIPIDENFWKNLDINQRYDKLQYRSAIYYNHNITASEAETGEKITTVKAEGTDPFDNKSHTKDASVYKLKKISDKIAVAVKFEESNKYFVYLNDFYEFETSGEIIDELKLRDNMKAINGYYEENDIALIRYEKIDTDVIWKMLLDDTTLTAIKVTDRILLPDFSVEIEVHPFSSDGSIAVTKDGYLIINIFHRETIFFIGREKAEKFIDYVMENYKGKKLVYTTDSPVVYDETAERIPVTEVFSNGYKP